MKQRLFAANAIPDGVFSIARRGYVVANDISGSISNAVGAAGVAGKCEQDKARKGAKFFLFVMVACITMHIVIEKCEKNQNQPTQPYRSRIIEFLGFNPVKYRVDATAFYRGF